MSTFAAALKEEVRRIARKEVKAETTHLKKQVAQHRREIAALKRENKATTSKLRFLETREKKRLGRSAPSEPPLGTRFSVRSLKAQRRRTGLSQANYALLVAVSTLTMNNWENEKTRPRPAQIAKIVSLRGLGKREAEKRLELLS